MSMSIPQTLGLAVQHHRAGRLAEAEAICRQILQQDPNHPEALNLLCMVTKDSGRLDDAIELAAYATAAHPRIAEFHANLGEFSRLAGKLDRSIDSFRRAIELKPSEPTFHSNLAMALGESRQYGLAAKEYYKAVELKPDYAAAFANMAGILRQLNRLDEAAAAAGNAIRIDPQLTTAHHNLATVLTDRGKHHEAVAAYSRAIAIDPNSSRSRTLSWNRLPPYRRSGKRMERTRVAIEHRPRAPSQTVARRESPRQDHSSHRGSGFRRPDPVLSICTHGGGDGRPRHSAHATRNSCRLMSSLRISHRLFRSGNRRRRLICFAL